MKKKGYFSPDYGGGRQVMSPSWAQAVARYRRAHQDLAAFQDGPGRDAGTPFR